MRSSPLRGVLLALTSALAFSSLVVWGKLAQRLELPAYTALPWRFAVVALVLFGTGLARGPFSGRDRAVMSGAGALYLLSTAALFLALERIPAGTTSLLLYLAPTFVVLYLWVLGQRPRALQVVALGVTALGLTLVIGLPGTGDSDPVGLLLGVLTGALFGAYLVFSDRHLRQPPLAATAHLALVAAAGFGLLGAATGTLGIPDGAAQWGLVLAMAVFPTLVAIPTLYAAIRLLGATRTSLLATTEPLWTVLLAFVLLGEPLGPDTLVGGVFILGGALLAQVGRPRVEPTAGEPSRRPNLLI